ncbi:MAG: hypothetical protein DMF59_00430 [Acidobacteria bacterium]|nr:MAG: hypothetical protein DMF59_00430 [Acidobacteriota bacterium]
MGRVFESPRGHQLAVQRRCRHRVYRSDGCPARNAALEAIRSEAFDAVVLDLVLPGVTGFEIIRKLNETHPYLLRRVVVLTAISESALADFPYEPLLWDLIRKPFDIDRLTRSLMRCIAFHAAPRRPLHTDLSDWLRQRGKCKGRNR